MARVIMRVNLHFFRLIFAPAGRFTPSFKMINFVPQILMVKQLLRCIAGLLLISGAAEPAQAQNDIDPTQPLTLQQCIQYAQAHNIQVKQSDLNLQLQDAALMQSKASVLPSLNANASHSYNFGRTIDPFTNQFATNKVVSDNFSISGNLTLFSGFQNFNTILQNNYNYLSAKYDLEKMKNDIALSVATNYLQILFNMELMKIAQAQVDITKQQVDRTQKMVDAGSLPKANLYEIQSQLASEELTLVNAQNQYDLSLLNLQQLLELQTPVTIVKPDIGAPTGNLLGSDPSQIFNTAVTNLPEIKSSEYKLLSAQKGVKIAYGGIYPHLTLSGSYGTGYSGASKELDGLPVITGYDTTGLTTGGDYVLIPTYDYHYKVKSFSDQVHDNLNKSIGLFLTVPLFNRLNNKTSITRSKISVMNAELSLQLAKNQLQKSIQQAYADASAAYKKYNASQKAVDAISESFKYMEQRYNVNLISTVEFNDAKNKLLKAQSDLLQAKYDYIFKVKILDFYQGKPLTL
jgi:outer membrane protein